MGYYHEYAIFKIFDKYVVLTSSNRHFLTFRVTGEPDKKRKRAPEDKSKSVEEEKRKKKEDSKGKDAEVKEPEAKKKKLSKDDSSSGSDDEEAGVHKTQKHYF